MQSKFKKFQLYQAQEDRLIDGQGVTMLINLDHLVSLKPINVPTAEGIVRAYWLRLSNGKKYKATQIPEELAQQFDADIEINSLGNESEALSELH